MKNMYIILTLALFCLGCLYAVEADEYLIGAYSQWRVDYENSDPAGAFSTLREKLYEGGFNAVNYTVLEEINFSNDKLGAVLSSLHNGGNESVRTILTDFSWKNEPTNNKIGAYSLFGNYLKMEAEYQLKYEDVVFVPDVLPTNDNTEDDSYNSVFRHETGKLSRYDSDNYQNGFAWICDEGDNHAAGMALSYPRFRWKPDNKNNPRTIGHDLKFRTRALAENKLYMTIALKVSGDETNIPIADIKFKVLKYASADAGNREWGDYLESDYYEFPLISTNPAAYSTTIYNREYPFVDIDDYGNHLFEYYIDLPPSDTALYEQLMGGYEFFFHLNPQVYWRGNGCLEIDYLVLQDEFQRTIDATRATNVYWGRLQSRLNQIDALDTNSNILYHYLMDEPFQGQFRMYDNIQNYMAGLGKDVMTATHLENPWLKKPNGYDNYKHYKLFLKEANPKIIALDSYPLQETGAADSDLIKWNHEVNDPRFVQTRIQEITIDHYHELTKSINEDNSPFSETKLIYIPQIFGGRYGNSDNTTHWKYLMPPLSMIRCLQMLPLCYAADGILSFTIASNPTTACRPDYYRVAPLQHSSQGLSTLTIDPQSSAFSYLTDANRKIAKYGPIIRKLLWRSADSIMNEGINQSTILSEYKLNDLSVVQSDIGHYEGYVQCGFYLDNYSLPTFMLVNRRSVFRTTSSNKVVQMPVDSNFVNAPPQTVCFEPDDPSHGIFGTHIALYDPYNDKIYKSTSGVIDVKIDPGDGKLLQMCSSLPQVVTSDADIKGIAYMDSSITIDQGAVVTIHPGTTTNIFAQSTILVKGGSTLSISGTVNIADNVSIIVENGSNIIFDNAICNWGINSILKVENSGITANNTILQSANAGETWRGLRINNAGTIGMVGTTITGAKSNEVTNSQVLLTDCRFNIPTDGIGLSITNTLPSQNVRITSSTDSKGFYSIGSNDIGLFFENPNACLFLENIVFDGLSTGFEGYLSSAVGDTIQYCHFSNNNTGLILYELQNSPLISNCTFYQNAIGAHFYAASPKVTECEFTGCDVGIRTELATATTGGIYDSVFSWGDIAIVSKGSNQRVSKNKFYTTTGILNHSGSILNMGNSAKNLFKAEYENLKFQDTHSYTARVQLYEGHNDFYHKNPGPLNPSHDFHFDLNWYLSPPPRSNAINASYNWFEGGTVKISSPSMPSQYAYCNYYDPSPNVFLENIERMAQAMDDESDGNYYSANNMYKTILDENEVSESDLLFDALDAYYRTAERAGDTLSGTESYLLAKIDQYETDNPILTKYLEDYLVKNRLQAGDFQTAINLLELRILNAESPIDSLHAVMNLEIVLQLATMSESKKPISTKLMQYKYPDRLTFKTKHEEHWELLDELLNDEEIDLIPIPDKALISSNYPNPFNPSTTIAYSVPKDGLVKIGIYNIKGQKVKELCNSEMLRGHHKLVWDGKDKHQRNVGSGVYFVKMQSGGDVSTRKIMLMK